MRKMWKRVLSLLLVVAMVMGDFVPVGATNVAEEELVTEVSENAGTTEDETAQDMVESEVTEQVETAEASEVTEMTEITEGSEFREETEQTEVTEKEENAESTERTEITEISNGVLDDRGAYYGDFEYYIKGDNTVEIVGFHGDNDTDVIIPEVMFDEYIVTSIDDSAFSGQTFDGKLVLPDSIISIGNKAFMNCGFVGELILPSNLISIGDYAFHGCGFTGNLLITEKLTTIGKQAFNGCNFTGDLVITNDMLGIGDSAFYYSGFTGKLILPSNLTSIGDYAFRGCNFTGELNLPDSLIDIGKGAFSECSFTGDLVIPDGVISIGDSAFSGCDFTGKWILPDSVEHIGDYAFQGCNFTGSLEWSSRFTSIGNGLFRSCQGFTGDLVIPDGVTSIGNSAFSGCGFTGNLIISDSVKSIGDYAFEGCEFTGNLSLPVGITDIGENAFAECKKFTGQLFLPKDLKSIKDNTFAGCKGFTGELKLPEGLENIEDCAFASCNGFTGELKLPEGLENIGEGAFVGCTGFTGTLILPTSLISIGDEAFGNCNFTGNLTLPNNLISIGKETFWDCKNLTGNLVLSDKLINIGDYSFWGCEFTGSLELPASLKTIGDSAFSSNNFVGNLTIPDGVTSIGDGAFFGCKFTGDLILPDSITYIGETAFDLNNFYGTLKLPAGLTVIGDRAFGGNFTGKLLLPECLTSIGDHAFSGCGFSGEIAFPKGMESIGDYAFSSVFNITDIYLPNTLIYIADTAFNEYKGDNLPITVHCEPNSYAWNWAVENGFLIEEVAVGKIKSHLITVRDKDTRKPIIGAEIFCGGIRYKTDKNGCIMITGEKSSYADVIISKAGYELKLMDLTLDAGRCTDIYLERTIQVSLGLPEVDGEAQIEHSVSILGKVLKWLDMESKFSIAPGGKKYKVPITFTPDEEKGTYKVTFGIKVTEDESDKEAAVVNKKMYNEVKDICDNLYSSKGGKKAHEFMKKHGWKQDGEIGVKVDTSFIGYFEFTFDEEGNFRILESGAIVGLEGKGEVKYKPAWGLGIIYAKAELSLSAEGELKMVFKVDNVNFEAVLDFKQALAVGIGADAKVAGIEVGVEGELEESINIPFKSMSESVEVALTAEFYYECELFGFKDKDTKKFLNIKLWPWGSSKTIVNYASSPDSTYNLDTMELMPRDYLISTMSLRPDSEIGGVSVYPEGTPEMVQLSDGTILAVWVTDNGTKTDANRTTLVYSVNQGEGFTSPVAVCETGRGDFYPTLKVVGDKAYLAYVNIDHDLTDSVTAEEMVKSTDVYYAVFENGSFSEPALVSGSKNQTMELNPIAVSNGTEQTVLWLENSENDPFLLAGTNVIYARTCSKGVWGATWCVAEGLGNISSLDAIYIGDKLNVAYVVDLDSNTDTLDDAEVFLYNNGTISRITSDNRIDRNVKFSKDMLYWTSDDEIMQIQNGLLATVMSTRVVGVDSFKVADNGKERAFILNCKNGFSSELYLSKENNGVFELPIPITDFGNKISDYAAVYKADKSLTAMIFETDVLEEDERVDNDPYGNTSMRIYEGLEATNLILTGVYHDESLVEPEATIPVELTLYNGGSKQLSSVKVTLKNGDMVVAEQNVICDIKAGEEGNVTINYQLGSVVEKHSLKVMVQPLDYEDANLTDNVMDIEIGIGDLTLNAMEVVYSADGTATLTGTIKNQGYRATNNVSLTLLSGGQDGEVLWTNHYGNMAAGAEYQVSYIIPTDKLSFSHENDGNYFYVKCSSDSEESRYDNNSETLVVFPTKVTGITLEQEALELAVKTRGQIHATVTSFEAMNQKIYYTTDDSRVAVVDENGVITATGVGTATITAITADGGFAKSCVVTVVEVEEGTILYGLSEQNVSLEKGDTVQLAVSDEEGNASTEKITWVSSDENIATVSENGLVTAVGAGIVQISASIGTTFYDVCMVKVSDNELKSILFEQETLELTEGETAVLAVYFYPAESTTDKTLAWTSSAPEVVAVAEDGTVMAVADGCATITAKTVNGLVAECKVTVTALPRYTVIFDSDLGSEPIEITGILAGETVILPDEPVRTGYEFGGWYTEKNGQGTLFTETTQISEDVIVYANWLYGLKYEEYSVEPISDQTYTGSQIKPEPVVLDGGTLLVKGVDYTLSYKNNTKVGTGQVIVKGKGNYTKSMTLEFTIIPKNLEDGDVTAVCADKVYNGKKQVSNPTVKWGKKTLKKGTDYTVVFSEDQTSKGAEVVVTIKGKGNYTGTITTTYRISEFNLSKVVTDAVPTQFYTGDAIEPDVKVYADKAAKKAGISLVEGVDYTVTYTNNVKAGTGKVILTGLGIYSGSKSVNFKIDKRSLASEGIRIVFEAPYETYTGGALKPNFKVLDGEIELILNTDYTVKYANNTNAMSADGKKPPKVTITGKGNYKGSISENFTIQVKELNAINGITITADDVMYSQSKANGKTGITTKVVVKDGTKTLKNGTHYTVEYVNNKALGEKIDENAPTIIITGKGNYVGSMRQTFRIYEGSASKLLVEKIPNQTYTGGSIEPKVVVYANKAEKNLGNALVEGVDYTVSYQNNVKAGTGKAIINGLGTFGGSKSVNFTISKRKMEPENIRIVQEQGSVVYTGSALKPEFKVLDGDVVLNEGIDYTVKYTNNVNVVAPTNKKQPTITVTGKGNYTGSIKQTFVIDEKIMSSETGISITATDVLYNQKKAASSAGITTTIVVKDGNKTLKKGTHYTVSFSNNRAVAEETSAEAPTVTITGKGNYEGTMNQTFRIYETDIKSVKVKGPGNQLYTGSVIEAKPEVTMKISKTETKTLVEGTDYILSWDNNVKIGVAKVTITGIGEYGGTKVVKFTILPKWLKWFQ